VIEVLKAAYVSGLVTKDEFDERVSRALASRTRAELAPVTADLPMHDTSPGLYRQGAVLQQMRTPGPGNRAIIATGVLAGLALVISISAGAFASPAAVLLLLGGAGSTLVFLILLRNRIRGPRHDERSGGHLPPQRQMPGTIS
jgi:hypothetical protein